jgi:hypothetical protein
MDWYAARAQTKGKKMNRATFQMRKYWRKRASSIMVFVAARLNERSRPCD